MRRIVVSNIVSLDGRYEGPDAGVMELNMDAFFDLHNLECLESADLVLLGARSYQAFSSYWPFVEHHPAVVEDHPSARAYDATNRRISHLWNTMPIVVVSNSYRVPDDAPWASHTTVIGRDQVSRWKQEGDEDVIVFGSRLAWNGLLAQGLVDELHLMVGPSALGGGPPAFDGRAELQLEDVRRRDGSGNVLLVYTPV